MAKRPLSKDDPEKEEESSMQTDEPSVIPAKKRQKVSDKPSFMPPPNESFFAQDPLNLTQQQPYTSSIAWEPTTENRERPPANISLYEETRSFDSLIQEMEREFDDVISRHVREHPLYDYCFLVIGALGRGNQQINPSLVFDTQEAKQLAASIISNMKLAMEIKLDLQRQHTSLFESKQKEETRIISKYRTLEKDEKIYQQYLAYISMMLSRDKPRSGSENDKELHKLLWTNVTDIFESLNAYRSYAVKFAALDNAMERYYDAKLEKAVRENDSWKDGTSLFKIQTAINAPYAVKRGSAKPPTDWIQSALSVFSDNDNTTIQNAIIDASKKISGIKKGDGFEPVYQMAFLTAYMALPHLLISNGMSGSTLNIGTRLNIELLCDLVHNTLVTSGQVTSKIDNFNSVLLELTGKNYFTPDSTEISMSADGDPTAQQKNLKQLTLLGDIDINDKDFHSKNVIKLVTKILDMVISIGIKRTLNTSPKISQLLQIFITKLAGIDNLYDDPKTSLDPRDIIERRLQLSNYYIAARFILPLLGWNYPFITQGESLLSSQLKETHTVVANRIANQLDQCSKDLTSPSPDDEPSKTFFDAADIGKGKLDTFTPAMVNIETNSDDVTTEFKSLQMIIKALNKEDISDDINDIITTPEDLALPLVDELSDVRSVLSFYAKIKVWLEKRKAFYEARLTNTRIRLQQVRNEAKRTRIFLGAEGETRPRSDQSDEETNTEKIIDEAFDERTAKMRAAIADAVAKLKGGEGIKIRADINYGSERVFSEISRVDPAWARQVGSWQRVATSRNTQARTLMGTATASIINESQVVSGTRGSYLQLDIRTFNIVNSAYAIESLLRISAYQI